MPIIAVTSIVPDGTTPALLTINGCDMDMQLDPVTEIYPEPRTTTRTVYVSPRPQVRYRLSDHRLEGARKDEEELVPHQMVEHTNKIHRKFEELGFEGYKPFVDVTQFDWIRIDNLPADTRLCVTGYNIKQSGECAYECFVY